MKILLYCTKAKPYLADFKRDYQTYSNGKELDELFDKGFNPNDIMSILNGKIVAECDFEVEEIFRDFIDGKDYTINPHGVWVKSYYFKTKTFYVNELYSRCCLTFEQMYNYFDDKDDKLVGYAIHIKNLQIFDKPRELYDCLIHPKIEPKYYGCEHLSKAPQNMMYVELDDIKYVLISIQPQWLCKILNGEKTIEVRKKVLKEMLGE